jgi:hypothetical protein
MIMIMRRFDVRLLFGIGLILLGGLMLLEKLGFLRGVGDLFWGLVFLGGSAYFFYLFFQDTRNQWWAIIPAMVLFAIGIEDFLPAALEPWDSALFLGSIGIAFWIVYLTDHTRWWGIIPGGVLTTLAAISVLEDVSGMETGSLFFLGLSLTFVLVALLPNPLGKSSMQWAYFPAGALAIIGLLIGNNSTEGLVAYIWPAALIIGGILIILGFFSKRE